MDIKLLIIAILFFAGLVMLIPVFTKAFKKNGALKAIFGILGFLLVAYSVVGAGSQFGWYNLPGNVGNFFLSASVPAGAVLDESGQITCPDGFYLSGGQCISSSSGGGNYQPVKSYSTINHFSSASVSGTAYYKEGNNKATTTAVTNTKESAIYQYWISNSTYYIKPKIFQGSNTESISNDEAYQNGSLTLNGYDLINDKATSSSAYNTSLASGTAKEKFTILGSATTANIPFGGVFVVEVNSTVTQVACSGSGISSTQGTGPYKITYTPSATTHIPYMYEVAEGYDVSPDGLVGVTKTIECSFTAGTNPGAGSAYYVKLIPADYYYVNVDGTIVKDTEQRLNGLSTRTGKGGTSATFYWG